MQQGDIFSLKDKVAFITGASKGIGEAIAHIFSDYGAKVVINSRKQDELDKVATAIRAKGGDCRVIVGNVGTPADCQQMIESIVALYGGIDILVNNAAANPIFGPVAETEEWAFNKIMEVNVKGPFQLSKLVYPHMKQRGGGAIINISSIAGITPDRGLGIYSVSKAALNMLTKVLASEWGPDGIRVNAICPGLIKTKFSQALWQNEQLLHQYVGRLPIARMGTPEEIAALALFLASDASSYSTGALFFADGGTTI